MEQITGNAENVEYRRGIAVSRGGNKCPRVPTYSYAGGIQALFYGSDMARAMKCLLEELIFGNMGPGIPTYVRSDNTDALYQVDSANTATNEKRLNGLLESNMGARIK